MKSLKLVSLCLASCAALAATNLARATFAGDPLFGNGLNGWTVAANDCNFGGCNPNTPGLVSAANSFMATSALGVGSLSGSSMAVVNTQGSDNLTGISLFKDFGAGTSQAVTVNLQVATLDPLGAFAFYQYASGGVFTQFPTLDLAAAGNSDWVSFVLPKGATSVEFDLFNGNAPKTQAAFLLVDTMTAPVPEPAEYALMLAGLGLLGFVARRRKPI